MLKRFLLSYVLLSAGVSIASIFLYWPPAPALMLWLADDEGKYPLALGLLLLFLIYLLPVVFVVLVINLIRGSKKTRTSMLLDQAILEITRKRALYGAVFGMDVYLNGTKAGTVMNGRTIQLPVAFGANEVHIQSQGKSTEKIIVELTENGLAAVTVGYRLAGSEQELFIQKS